MRDIVIKATWATLWAVFGAHTEQLASRYGLLPGMAVVHEEQYIDGMAAESHDQALMQQFLSEKLPLAGKKRK